MTSSVKGRFSPVTTTTTTSGMITGVTPVKTTAITPGTITGMAIAATTMLTTYEAPAAGA